MNSVLKCRSQPGEPCMCNSLAVFFLKPFADLRTGRILRQSQTYATHSLFSCDIAMKDQESLLVLSPSITRKTTQRLTTTGNENASDSRHEFRASSIPVSVRVIHCVFTTLPTSCRIDISALAQFIPRTESKQSPQVTGNTTCPETSSMRCSGNSAWTLNWQILSWTKTVIAV